MHGVLNIIKIKMNSENFKVMHFFKVIANNIMTKLTDLKIHYYALNFE